MKAARIRYFRQQAEKFFRKADARHQPPAAWWAQPLSVSSRTIHKIRAGEVLPDLSTIAAILELKHLYEIGATTFPKLGDEWSATAVVRALLLTNCPPRKRGEMSQKDGAVFGLTGRSDEKTQDLKTAFQPRRHIEALRRKN